MKKHSFGQFAAVLLICTAVLSIGISWYVESLHQTLVRETRSYLQEFALQDARHLEMQVQEDLDLLRSIAVSIDAFDSTDEQLLNLLREERTQNNFKNMEFVSTDGIAHLDNDTYLDLSGQKHIQIALEGKANVSDRARDLIDGENILVFAVPVYQDGEIIGALSATRRTADFARTLTMESFAGDGYSLLVEADGDKVVESFHKNAVSGLYNIFDMPDDPDHILREQVLADFTNRQAGFVRYVSKKRGTLYVNYQPLTINDWFLVCVVPSQHLNALTKHFVTLLVVLCLGIALLGIFLGGYLRHAWPHVFKDE